ncbi:MAG: hypothetical protein U0Q55_10790 [Vicinamibacterales bacterium]
MTLRNVHVLFVVSAVLLVLFCGAEAVRAFLRAGSVLMAGAAAGAVLAAGLLVRYELTFLRRCREAGIR